MSEVERIRDRHKEELDTAYRAEVRHLRDPWEVPDSISDWAWGRDTSTPPGPPLSPPFTWNDFRVGLAKLCWWRKARPIDLRRRW